MRLDGKRALVFGAGSGIGRASAVACAEEGAQVMVSDVQPDMEETVEAVRAAGGRAATVRADITEEGEVRDAVEATVKTFGGLDVLVTSAGAGGGGQGRWQRHVELYLNGPFHACKHGVAAMERSGGGSIVNIASIGGVTGSVAETVEDTGYGCAKHGVIGLTRTIALAYAEKNIRANAVCPGYVRTPMTRKLFEDPERSRELIEERLRVPMKRWGEPHEIGKVVAFLASDDASFITGQPIIVDGGFMAR